LIQTAALLGFLPARNLLVRTILNKVRARPPGRSGARTSSAMRPRSSCRPERFRRTPKPCSRPWHRHFCGLRTKMSVPRPTLESLRGDARLQTSYRIDTLLEILVRVRGACARWRHLVGEHRTNGHDARMPRQSAAAPDREQQKPVDRETIQSGRGFAWLNKLGAREARYPIGSALFSTRSLGNLSNVEEQPPALISKCDSLPRNDIPTGSVASRFSGRRRPGHWRPRSRPDR